MKPLTLKSGARAAGPIVWTMLALGLGLLGPMAPWARAQFINVPLPVSQANGGLGVVGGNLLAGKVYSTTPLPSGEAAGTDFFWLTVNTNQTYFIYLPGAGNGPDQGVYDDTNNFNSPNFNGASSIIYRFTNSPVILIDDGFHGGDLIGTQIYAMATNVYGYLNGVIGSNTVINPAALTPVGQSISVFETNLNTVTNGSISLSTYAAIAYNKNSHYKGPVMCINTWSANGNNGSTETGAGAVSDAFINTVLNLYNSPLRNMGFDTAVIDGGWLGYRDASGFIHENAHEWPDGISNCVTFAHSLGIKVGIWHSTQLCTTNGEGLNQGFAMQITNSGHVYYVGNTNVSQLYQDSYGENQLMANDAATFASWGIDYIKLEGGTNTTFTDAQWNQAVQIFKATYIAAGRVPYIMGAVGSDYGQPWMTGVINAQRAGSFDMPNSSVGVSGIWSQFMNNYYWCYQLQAQSGPGNYCSTDIIPNGIDTNRTSSLLMLQAMLSSELSLNNAYPFLGPIPYSLQNIVAVDQDPGAIMANCVFTNLDLSSTNITTTNIYNPQGTNTVFYMFWGAYNTYATFSSAVPFLTNSGNVAVSSNYVITNLQPMTTYQWHFVVSNTVTTVNTHIYDSPAIATTGDSVWVKPLLAEPGSAAISFINPGTNTWTYTVTNIGQAIASSATNFYAIDLISNTIVLAGNTLSVSVPSYMAYGYKFQPAPYSGYHASSASLLTNGAPPAPMTGAGIFWPSNYDLYWVTPTKTNLIVAGH